MKKTLIVLGAMVSVLIMISTATAMPVIKANPVKNKLEEIKEKQNIDIKDDPIRLADLLLSFIESRFQKIVERLGIWNKIAEIIDSIYNRKYDRLINIANYLYDQGFKGIGNLLSFVAPGLIYLRRGPVSFGFETLFALRLSPLILLYFVYLILTA